MPAKIYYESNKEHHKKVSCDYHDNKEHVLEYQKVDIAISVKKRRMKKLYMQKTGIIM